MRLGRIALLVLMLLAGSATAAIAAVSWQQGDYGGTSAGMFKPSGNKPLRRAKITFHVGTDRLTRIKVEIRVKCADGSHTSFKTDHGGYLALRSDGTFNGGAPTRTGRDNIAGKVTGNTASGIVRSFEKEDQDGFEDPNGQLCDSGRVKWSAKKQ
jgi:hypothetical protein